MRTGWLSWLVDWNRGGKKLEAIPSSKDVIRSRIVDISFNILKHVVEDVEASRFPFSMRLDEIIEVCLVHADDIREEFLFCESFLETTKAIDILEMVKIVYAK
jgi:hypothetical protein